MKHRIISEIEMHTFNLHLELSGYKTCFCAIALGASCRYVFVPEETSPQE